MKPKLLAPHGHRRALEIEGGVDEVMRIRCQCGWASLFLPRKAAEKAYDAHLLRNKR